jgi:tryptophan-rich sensory protein
MKLHRLVIPLLTFAVALFGRWATEAGLGSWYASLHLPGWTPSGAIIGIIWTIIYVFAALAAILAYEHVPGGWMRRRVMWLFGLNGLANAAWSFLFFRMHRLDWAMYDVLFLWLILLLLIITLLRRHARRSAWLLFPYLAWLSFVVLLSYLIWSMN